MDLFYGAVNNSEEFTQSPIDYEPVVQEYKLASLEPGVTAPKARWIELYSEMNKENIIAHAKNIASSLNWSEDEAINLIQFLKFW